MACKLYLNKADKKLSETWDVLKRIPSLPGIWAPLGSTNLKASPPV